LRRRATALESIAGTGEAALYDPHPAIIAGHKYLSYSGSAHIGTKEPGSGGLWVGQPDIYLVKSQSNTWDGPWINRTKILDHTEIVHHNQKNHLTYEWGLEGSQLIELPNGIIMMNAVCFLPHGEFGTRQRVFFAFARSVKGKFYSAGTVLPPLEEWESGENGHAAAFMRGPDMYLFYQGRPPGQEPWRYGIAVFENNTLEAIGRQTLAYHEALNKITRTTSQNAVRRLADRINHLDTVISLSDWARETRSALRSYRHKE
jgi:hypothetical protein